MTTKSDKLSRFCLKRIIWEQTVHNITSKYFKLEYQTILAVILLITKNVDQHLCLNNSSFLMIVEHICLNCYMGYLFNISCLDNQAFTCWTMDLSGCTRTMRLWIVKASDIGADQWTLAYPLDFRVPTGFRVLHIYSHVKSLLDRVWVDWEGGAGSYLQDLILALWQGKEGLPIHRQEQETSLTGLVQVGDVCLEVTTEKTNSQVRNVFQEVTTENTKQPDKKHMPGSEHWKPVNRSVYLYHKEPRQTLSLIQKVSTTMS